RLNERVHDLVAGRRIDVRVELADDEHEMALKLFRIDDIRRRFVVRSDRPTHPLLVPPDLVHPVVVTAGIRIRDFIKLWVEDETTHRVLTTGRRSIEPDARR